MKLSTPRYTFCLFFQLIFIFCDLIFNCVTLFPRSRDGLLVLFIFQDLFLVLSITTMLMTFFSTYLFQAGLVEALVRKARAGALAGAAYACACVALHAAWLLHAPAGPARSTPLLTCLFTLQRCLSPWYYYAHKRAALRVSDPRLYEDLEWMARRPRAR